MRKKAVERLQEAFALIELSGEVRVLKKQDIRNILNGDRCQDLNFYRRSEAQLVMQRALEASDIGIEQLNPVISDFFTSPKTTHYTKTAFSPSEQPVHVLNLWCGHVPEPKAGDWSVIEDLLREVICAGSIINYEYHLNYLAHMVQKPDEKPGVMIVYMGGQGNGKGSMCRLLEAIWSHSTLQVSDTEDVVGRFTGSLERSYVVFMDEALFAGDKKAQDRLKSLITEPTLRIEEKYQPKRTIDSFHRFFAATNHKQFAQLDIDDRRLFILKVSEHRKVDRSAPITTQGEQEAYWDRLHIAFKDGVTIPAFLEHLLEIDLTSFSVRRLPSTSAHKEQRMLSLDSFNKFLLDTLQTGEIAGGSKPHNWNESFWISTEELKSAFTAYDKNAERYTPLSLNQMNQKIREAIPSTITGQRRYCDVYRRQKRGIVFPSLTKARTEFGRTIGYEGFDWEI